MLNFNQEINVKKFDLNLKDFSPYRLGKIVLSNTKYTVLFTHNPEKKNYKLLIGLYVKPFCEETQGVEIMLFSHSTFPNGIKFTPQELIEIFENSIFALNEDFLRKLRDSNIEIPPPTYKDQIKLELYEQYYEEYQKQ